MSSTADNPIGATEAVTATPAKTITLKTADNNYFDVEESVAMELVTVKTFFDDNISGATADAVIPLPNVSAKYLSLIIQYLKQQMKFRQESTRQDARRDYDARFVEELSNEDLKELLLAVNYLDIKAFMDMLNQTVADRIKNKSVEYVRSFFGIENDFTPEEEAMIREENPWAYENIDN